MVSQNLSNAVVVVSCFQSICNCSLDTHTHVKNVLKFTLKEVNPARWNIQTRKHLYSMLFQHNSSIAHHRLNTMLAGQEPKTHLNSVHSFNRPSLCMFNSDLKSSSTEVNPMMFGIGQKCYTPSTSPFWHTVSWSRAQCVHPFNCL